MIAGRQRGVQVGFPLGGTGAGAPVAMFADPQVNPSSTLSTDERSPSGRHK